MRVVHRPELDGLRRSVRGKRNSHPIVLGQAASLLGDYVAYITLPLFVLSLTDRVTDLGKAAALETLPLVLFGLVAGAILDRYRIRPILIGADLVRAGIFGWLAFGASSGTIGLSAVFAAAFAVGTMSVFFDSGLQTLLPTVIPARHLAVINSHLALARTFAFAIGPALGGALVATSGGFPLAFGIQAATFVVSALSLLLVRPTHRVERTATERFARSVISGVRELIKLRPLVIATLAASFVNFVFAPLEALLVVYVRDNAAPEFTVSGLLSPLFSDLGAVGMFISAQALVGTVLLLGASRAVKKLPLGMFFVAGMILMGSGFTVMLLMDSFFGFIPAGFSLAGVGMVNIAFVTSRQRLSPPAYLGRITAASRTVAYASLPLGTLIGTTFADRIGVTSVYAVGALSVVVVGLLLLPTRLGRLSFGGDA